MVLDINKIYVPASSDELRARWLDDFDLEARNNGIDNAPVAPGTDVYIRATTTANALMLIYASIQKRHAAGRVLEADKDELDRIRIELGLPEVPASRSSGKASIVVLGGGTVTIPDGTEGVLPNGLRVKTDGAKVGLSNGGIVDIVSIDEGEDTNAAVGTKIRWVNPPLNVGTEATVSTALTGGTDEESESRMRNRILNRLKNNPQGGNWSQIVEWVLDGDSSVQYAFVYPALGGPSSFRVALTKAVTIDDDTATYDFSRAPSATQISTAIASIQEHAPEHVKFDVVEPTEVNADASIKIDIPGSDDGTDGWENEAVWPQLESADNGKVTVTAVGSTTDITVSANTATAPVDGVTKIMWWSPTEQRFYPVVVSSHSGSAGAWQLTLASPLSDATGTSVAVGDYISPSAANADNYTTSWRNTLKNHGPGECTQDSNRLPRAERHPDEREEVAEHGNFPMNMGNIELCSFQEGNTEITNLEWSYRAVTGPSLGAVFGISNPEILVTRHFGVYKL